MDTHKKYLKDTEAFYLLNHERFIHEGAGLGKSRPMVANYKACDMQLPSGENYRTGKYYSPRTGELYSWVYNHNGVHYIQRINKKGECEVVYYGNLKLSAEPRHEITQFRAWLQLDNYCGYDTKQLIWTDGNGFIGQIDVEASIATNNFTTDFFKRCEDVLAPIRMCVPDPCDCLNGEFIPLADTEKGLSNHLLDTGFKFSYMYEYYDGRRSIWADPSSLFYQDTKGCFDSSEGFPRCIKLRVPIGNPLVDKIHIGFTKGELNESGQSIWYVTEVVEKYKKFNAGQGDWWERDLAELLNYSDDDCSFDYIFCNDKQCDILNIADFNRVYNPMPIQPQVLIPVNDAVGFINYKSGVCPVDDAEIAKIEIKAKCTEVACKTEYATITVRAIIHNFTHNANQFIFRMGGGVSSPDDPADIAYFGGLNSLSDGDIELGYDQSFTNKTRNLIAYIDGTDYWAEMKQWKSSAYFVGRSLYGVVSGLSDNKNKRNIRRAIFDGLFFYQEAKIKVPKGTRGYIRLANHKQNSGTGANQDTSTQVVGTISSLTTYGGFINLNGSSLMDFNARELYFDTCNGDTEINAAFVLSDMAVDTGSTTKATAFYGYVKDKNNLPVEGAEIYYSTFKRATTDHNGYYNFYIYPGINTSINLETRVELDCGANFIASQSESVTGESGATTRKDFEIASEDYKNNYFLNVLVPVKDCNGRPVSGVRVSMSGSKYRVTDGMGIAKFKTRNYSSRDREYKAVIINNNDCFDIDCLGNCNACMPITSSTTPTPCYQNKPTLTMTSMAININSININNRGLKAGGRYPFGVYIRYDCGRISSVYKVIYLDIPRTQEKSAESFCSIEYDGHGITLPKDATCLSIVRGENQNPFELQWVVDKIEKTTDGKLKLTIQSLVDYNEKYFFKTNTIYQWLKGDRAEFIKNGDGTIFQSSVNGLLNYLTISPFNDEQVSGETESENFFNQLIIEDDGRLDGLIEGAVIELQRSKECTTEPEYHSICVNIPVVDGKLMIDKGEFTTFDTYFINRTIGNFPSIRFEHHSPSDFWGDRLSDIGRAYFVNQYEGEVKNGRGYTLNTPNEFNRFGDFVGVFDSPEHGDVIAATVNDGRIGLCISQKDNGLFEVGGDLLKVGNDNIVRAASPDNIISNPQPKLSGKYGCDYDYIGGIYFGDGYATWGDVYNGFIKHDYQQAKPADEGKMQSYFKKRFQEVLAHNIITTDPLDKYRFMTGYNSYTKAIQFTMKSLRHSAVNNSKKVYQLPNETILYHPLAEDFPTFASYTPDGYGELDLDINGGCAFVSFFNGVPYIHPSSSDKFNEFFGIPVDRVVGVVINKFPEKSKQGLSIEIKDDMRWFGYEILTESTNFRSEIPAIRWKKTLNKWNAAFLFNINSRGGLYGSDKLVVAEPAKGHFISVLLVRDNTQDLIYNSIDNAKRILFDELDEIIFKFKVNEQSGMTENM